MKRKKDITRKTVIIICTIFAIVLICPTVNTVNAKSLKEKALTAYNGFLKSHNGYYATAKIKGCKAPVLLYTDNAYETYKGDSLSASSCKLYYYSKGKVKKVKDEYHLLESNTTSTEIGIYKRKICLSTHNATRELYLKKGKLTGQAIFEIYWENQFYKYKIMNGKQGKVKKISMKKGRAFRNTRMNKSRTIAFKRI